MREDVDAQAWLRRLRLVGIVVPLASVIGLHLLMNQVLDRLWPAHTVLIGWLVGGLGLVVFALAMSHLTHFGHSLLTAQTEARLESQRRVAVLEERERIAREMHDSLAQVLGVAHLQLRAMSTASDASPELRDQMDQLADTCHQAYADVREAILGLREDVGAERSLLEGLEHYLQAFGRSTGIQTALLVDPALEPELSPLAEVQLIRIMQEALTNVRKHAEASRVEVEVTRQARLLRFSVRDDGQGFDPGHAAPGIDGGYGLQTMRERTAEVGGRIQVDSRPGSGTCVQVEVPERVAGAVR